LFFTLPWTVAVSMSVDPAEPTTVPSMWTATVPPALRRRVEQRTSGAATVHVPVVPFVTVTVAVTLAASRPWVPSVMTTSSARLAAVFVTRMS